MTARKLSKLTKTLTFAQKYCLPRASLSRPLLPLSSQPANENIASLPSLPGVYSLAYRRASENLNVSLSPYTADKKNRSDVQKKILRKICTLAVVAFADEASQWSLSAR